MPTLTASELTPAQMIKWVNNKQAYVDLANGDRYDYYITRTDCDRKWQVYADDHEPEDLDFYGVAQSFKTIAIAQEYLLEHAEDFARCQKEIMADNDAEENEVPIAPSNLLTWDGWFNAPIRFIKKPEGDRKFCVFVKSLNQWVGEGRMVDSGNDASVMDLAQAKKFISGQIFDLTASPED